MDDVHHFLAKTHLQAFVVFVNDEYAHAERIEIVLVQMVAQAARRCEDDLWTNFVQAAVFLHRGAAAIEATGFDVGLETPQHFLALQGQFAGGEHHNGLYGRNVRADEFQHRKEVGQRLARTRWGEQ